MRVELSSLKWLKTRKQKTILVGLATKLMKRIQRCSQLEKLTAQFNFLKKLIQVLNPREEALFQRPKRKFCLNDEIWFDKAPLGVNSLGNMMKEISFAAKLSQTYTNHCIRATSVTLLDRVGIPVHRIINRIINKRKNWTCDHDTKTFRRKT